MGSKVFLFDRNGWLYCTDVTLKDGVYRGHVVNGYWHLVYDTNTGSFQAYRDSSEERLGYAPVTNGTSQLTWACDVKALHLDRHDYNHVITTAKAAYDTGTKPVFKVSKEYVDPEYKKYLKLKKKFEDLEDDEVPF